MTRQLASSFFAAFSSSIFLTRFTNSSYWHFSYECLSSWERQNGPSGQEAVVPCISTARTTSLSGTRSGGSAGGRSGLCTPTAVWRPTSPGAWPLFSHVSLLQRRRRADTNDWRVSIYLPRRSISLVRGDGSKDLQLWITCRQRSRLQSSDHPQGSAGTIVDPQWRRADALQGSGSQLSLAAGERNRVFQSRTTRRRMWISCLVSQTDTLPTSLLRHRA
jgi:hypothetical protein